MPPKARYTKEEILDVAYSMVKKHGMQILSARSLAAELGTSTAPIFTAFQSIEEIQCLVIEKAKELYQEKYINEGLKQTPPFKGAGLKYVQFAKDEPELFKVLFMQSDNLDESNATHFLPSGDENAGAVLGAVQGSYGLEGEDARSLYNHLSVYTHGLAVLYAQHRCVFTMEDVSRMLSEIFIALTKEKGI